MKTKCERLMPLVSFDSDAISITVWPQCVLNTTSLHKKSNVEKWRGMLPWSVFFNAFHLRFLPTFLSSGRLFIPNRMTQRNIPQNTHYIIVLINACNKWSDRLCGLVVTVYGYRYRGPGFDPRRYQIFWVVVGLERGSLSLVRSIEELLEWKK